MGPKPIRCCPSDAEFLAALEQMLHHISAQCNRLVEAAAADRAATARRCLQEAVQLVSALQASPAWARDAALSRRCGSAAQVLLLHLLKVCCAVNPNKLVLCVL